MIRILAWGIIATQLLLATRFLRQLFSTRHGKQISLSQATSGMTGSVTVVVPVLDEVDRVADCLASLTRQDKSVAEVLVVDGGSSDGTRALVANYAAADSRIRLIAADPVPKGWNGKAWGLDVGLRNSSETSRWIVTIDADVRCAPTACASAVRFADANRVPFLSLACNQVASTRGLSLVHPSLLSTLVYRFGIPGHTARAIEEVQANGQFALYERENLLRAGGFAIARGSICEDVTLARHLFLSGYEVGFYEGPGLAETQMYPDARTCLANWPRSLALRDRFLSKAGRDGLANLVFLQLLPLLAAWWSPPGGATGRVFVGANRALLACRIGILVGTRRAYSRVSWTYWLSPIFDPVSAILYAWNLLRRTHTWRGRQLVDEEVS
ncbi:MAG: glycosyltransferase family 2 protein [Thermomicrobiaceae bacterium]